MFENLGKGPQKADFDVRWQNISYPVKDSEQVTTNDQIKFTVRIKSSYASDKKFEYRLSVINPQTDALVYTIASDRIMVASNTACTKNFTHTVTKQNSVQFAENKIILSVKAIGSAKEKRKELPFFYDINKPDNSRDKISLFLHECVFPVENSRRINFDESLKDISYIIENKRNCELNYRLNISIHNASIPSCPKIVDVNSQTGIVAPYEEFVTPPIKEFTFERNIFEQHLSEGILELRARLIANADDPQYEKGNKITSYHYKIFLNSDEKNGKNDSFNVQSVFAPEDYRRSWCTAGIGRTITLNVGHAAYLNVADYPDIQHDYMKEQLLKQYVLLYLAEGKYDMFGMQGKDFTDLEPQEAAEQILQKIESVYYQSLK